MKRLYTLLVFLITGLFLSASSSVPISGEPKTTDSILESEIVDASSIAATNQDCCDIVDSKPTELTFEFVGGGCAADNNSQDDKSDCVGGVTGSGPYSYTAEDKDGNVFQSGSITVGDIFTIVDGGDKLPNPTWIMINNGQEQLEVHTSCSAPLVPGERYGSLELLSMKFENGEECGDPCPDPGIQFNPVQCIEDPAIFSLSSPEFGVSYSWNFGVDAIPATYTGNNPPAVIYTSTGLKTVTVTQNGTCPVSVSVNVGECECPEPEIDFDLVCAGVSTTFSTPDLGPDYIYEWNFGSGAMPQTATGRGPHIVTYGFAGSATVRLDVERECEDIPEYTGDCCDDFSGKPINMTFRYVGGGCAASNNNQDSGKWDCSGNANNASPANITITDKDDKVMFSGSISLNQEFTVDNGGDDFDSNTYWYINGSQEEGRIHTSCSAPLAVGDQFGSLLVVGIEFQDGVCGQGGSGGGSGATDCCDDVSGKPAELTFVMQGGGCAADDNSQGDKSDCNGGVSGSGPFTWTAYDKDNKPFQSGTVSLGGTFTVQDGGDKLPNPTYIYLNGGQEQIEVHTSCSAPIIMGERYGSLELVGMVTEINESCAPYVPPVVCFPCTGSNEVYIDIEIPYECPDDENLDCYDDIYTVTSEPTLYCGGTAEYVDETVAYTCPDIQTIKRTWTISVPCNTPEEPETPPFTPTGDCCDEFDGKPAEIVFRYVGGGCAASNNNQDSDKWDCSGSANNVSPANITITDKDDNVMFSGSVSLNQDFTVDNNGDKFDSNTYWYINGGQEEGRIHTSCSAPLAVGDQFGSLLVIGITSDDGEVCGEGGTGGSGGSDCCDQVDDKPAYLTFEFSGGGCAADNNSQGDKSDCSGGATGSGPFSWTAYDKDDKSFQSGTVSLGGSFTVSDGGDKLPNPTTIKINGGQEIIEIHTSCSAPMVMGERYGSLTLTNMVTETNETCSYIPPPPPPPPGECTVEFECIQYIYIDSYPPTIVCPPDMTVECYDHITIGTPTVTVSCGADYDITTSGPTLVNGQDDCPGAKYEIVYTVTDECGRSASCTQTITIHNDPPTIVCPPDMTVECYDDIYEGTPTVTTSCYLGYTVSVTGPTLVFGQDMCDGARYQYVYTATDDCGRSASCTQTFTLDNEGPTIVCPPDMTIECVDDMVEGIPTVTTSCGLDYEVYVAIPDLFGPTINCPGNEYFILYEVVDECGRTASCTQKFTIENDPPTIVCPPDMTLECYEDIYEGVPTVTTSCFLDYTVTTTGPTLIFGQDFCDGAIYEIVYTATDVCGRSASCTQKFTIENEGPTITCPHDMTVECYDDIIPGTPAVHVACYLEYDITYTGPTLVYGEEDCPGAIYEIVYTVTDECGRYATCTQKWTIHNDPPTIVCPPDQTVECYYEIDLGIPIVTTSCYLGYVVTTIGPHLVHGQDDCPGAIYEITYEVTDDCGRKAQCTQKFTIHNDPPTIVCPHDVTVECYDDIEEGIPTVTTSCYLGYFVNVNGPHLVHGQHDCPGAKYEITYTVYDDCGRTASCVQTFTIHNDPPTIVCPPDQTVECYDDIHEGVPTVHTSCHLGYVVTTTGPTLVYGQDDCYGARYEIVYTVTDDCGRKAHCTQTFTIHNDPPTIVCPPDKTVECYDDIYEGTPTVHTSCHLGYHITTSGPHLVLGHHNCPGAKYEIVYTVTDDCGRKAHCTQTFTIHNDPPTIICPPDKTIECVYEIVEGIPIVTTSCDLGYQVFIAMPSIFGPTINCPGAEYYITYTVEDDCGRTATCKQKFTIYNDPPTITCPPDEVVECYDYIHLGTPIVHTSCDLGYDVTTSGPHLVHGTHNCPGAKYEIVYTVTDVCGRKAHCTQTFTIYNDPPTIVCPPDQTVECYDDIYIGTPTVHTSCHLGYVVTTSGPTLVYGQHNCYDAIYEVVYTVTDDCGRKAHCTQRFTIDNHGPTIVCPPDQTVECYYDIESGIPTVTTSCGLGYDIFVVGPPLVIGQENCPGMEYYITYSVVDECGRTATCRQKFTIHNNPPTIVCPPDQTVECYDDIHVGTPHVTTSCDMPYTVTTSGPHLVQGEGECPGDKYEIIYTVTDECGRQAHCTQTFTIHNNPPTIVCPPDAVVECYDDIQIGIPTVFTSCHLGYVVTTSGPYLVHGQHNCHGARYEITYTVTDDCGRKAHCTQIFTLNNNGPSILCPADKVVECYDDIRPGTPIVFTSCHLGYVVTTSGPHLVHGQHNCYGAQYEVVYTVTDDCGRQAQCTQTFTIDNHPPTIVCPPDQFVECFDDIQAGIPTVFTSCHLGYVVTTSGPHLVLGQDNCHGARYEIVYTVTDDCGRQAHCTQTFTIDNHPPTIVCPPDRVVECESDIRSGTPTVHTSCHLGYIVTTSGPHLVFGQADCDGARYEIVYTVTDDCGRQAHCTQTFTLRNNGPTIICPPDRIIECVSDMREEIPTVIISCGADYEVFIAMPTIVGVDANCPGKEYFILYSVVDECGRTATCTQKFTIANDGPRIICPNDQIVECYDDIIIGIPTVTSSCNLSYNVTTSGPHLVFGQHNCHGAIYEVIYTVTDVCGRSASCAQIFTIDNLPPTIVCPPDQIVECYDFIFVGSPTVHTSCGFGYNVTTSGPHLVFGQHNCHGAVYEIIYTVTDDCGRQSHCTQKFTLDNDGPTISCPANTVVECYAHIVAGTPTVHTSCGVGYTTTVHGPTLVSGHHNCNGAIYQIVYSVTDDCGRTASCTQIWSIDNDGPTIDCPIDVNVGRIEEFIPGTPIYNTSCGMGGVITGSGPVLISGHDCENGVYEYTYTVTDACGRTASCTQRIYINPTDLDCHTSATPTSCGNSNGSATVVATGGYAPYTYLWSTGATSSTIANRSAGTYTVTVTDDMGCVTVCSAYIAPSTNPICSVTGVDATCDEANGSATVTTMFGIPPYSYQWSNGANTATVTGLVSGNYTVTVTDANNCYTTCDVYIGDTVPPTCYATGTNTTCQGSNGSATAYGIGGSGIYNYLWSTGETSQTIHNLSPGTYTVVVTDSNGCVTTCSVSIKDSDAPRCSVNSTATTCGFSNGSATAFATGGTPPYSYYWNTGESTQSINNLAAGTYTVVISDALGCQTTCTTVVQGSNPPTCSINSTPTTCGSANGSASVSVNGGSGSYSYAWSNGANSQTVFGLAPGFYSVTVTDNNTSCTTSCSVTIFDSNPISCTVTGVPTTCGFPNGSATVSVSGGSGSYTYAWSNGASTQTVTGLASGSYNVEVTDVNSGCVSSCQVIIAPSNPISCSIDGTDPSCGASNGSATVSVFGGSGNYSYAWSNGMSTQSITGMPAGTYVVTVIDNNTGCQTNCSVTLQDSEDLRCSISGTDPTCGNNNGHATVSITGGTGNYSIVWNTGSTSATITGLTGGTYSATVTDNISGCITTCSVTLQHSVPISCAITSVPSSCGENNATATALVSGGSGNYTYAWSNGANTQTVTNLGPGTYTVQVTDNVTGCTTSCYVDITPSSPINCAISSTNCSCGLHNGTASVQVAGGSGAYTYQWSHGATTAAVVDLAPGTYTVTVTDAQGGCVTTCTATIGGSNAISCTTSTTDTDCGATNGTASVHVSGGSGNYNYSWSNGANTSNISGLAAGTYTVLVTDLATGCITSCVATVNGSAPIACSINSTNASCGLANGSATVLVSGGSGSYSYSWNNGATSASIFDLAGGTYFVTVVDNVTGCSSNCSVLILDNGSPSCIITNQNATCGQATGSATVIAIGGSGVYTYLWSNGATTATITNVPSGTYAVTVTDQGGCTTICNTVIALEPAPSCNATSTDATCGQNNGTATVTASGGIPGYTYLWSTGATTASISGLAAGNYSVTVFDSNGCPSVCNVTVGSTGNFACSVTGTDASCGDNNGTATAYASGGTAPYSYLWSNGATTASVTGLVAGTYNVIITDANGCASACSITIESIGGPTCTITVYDASCGSSNGALTASAVGGSGLYSFQWSNGGTSPTISGLPAGFYSVTITDQKGCTTVCSAEVGNDGTNCNAEVGDFVWEDLNADGIQDANEPGIADVQVTLWNANSGSIVSIQTTDEFGAFCFTGLAEGYYFVEFGSLPPTYVDYVASPNVLQLVYQDVNCDISGANGNRTTNTFYLAMGDKNKSIDAGFYKGATIGNHVWCDNPEDGMPNLYDSNDTPIEGAKVSLYRFDLTSGTENLVGSVLTDVNGNYQFTGLPAGTYIIEVDVTTIGKVFVSANAQDIFGNQPDDLDSDIIYRILEEQDHLGNTRSVGRTNLITLTTGEVNNTIDCGLGEGTVPIELYDFVGRWNESRELTELEWVTDIELKSSYFAIERTNDLSEDFEEIGTVAAAGYSVTTNYYDYEDDTIFESGTYYYRLRMVDLDGSFSYSKVVVVEVEMERRDQKIGFFVYPNPVIDEVTVEMTVERRSAVEGGIFDAIGQLIKKFEISSIEAGQTAYKVDVTDLPVGTYLLRVKIDNDVIFEKITKTE